MSNLDVKEGIRTRNELVLDKNHGINEGYNSNSNSDVTLEIKIKISSSQWKYNGDEKKVSSETWF